MTLRQREDGGEGKYRKQDCSAKGVRTPNGRPSPEKSKHHYWNTPSLGKTSEPLRRGVVRESFRVSTASKDADIRPIRLEVAESMGPETR
jgi:hypothetical protein